MSPVFARPLAAALLASLVTVTTPLLAAESGARTLSVAYSDLDLTTKDGRVALERRVERAVKRVCASLDDKQLKFALESRACREATLASADVGLRQAIALAASNRSIGG